MKVIFDIPTPRAHFIVRENPCSKTPTLDVLCALADDELAEFVAFLEDFVARVRCKAAGMTTAVLSIHTGDFQSDTIFHVHVCVDSAPYLAMLEDPPFPLQPVNWQKAKITRKWGRISPATPNNKRAAYHRLVLAYDDQCKEKGSQYWRDDVEQVLPCCPTCPILDRTVDSGVQCSNAFAPLLDTDDDAQQ